MSQPDTDPGTQFPEGGAQRSPLTQGAASGEGAAERWTIYVCPTSNSPYTCSCDIPFDEECPEREVVVRRASALEELEGLLVEAETRLRACYSAWADKWCDGLNRRIAAENALDTADRLRASLSSTGGRRR